MAEYLEVDVLSDTSHNLSEEDPQSSEITIFLKQQLQEDIGQGRGGLLFVDLKRERKVRLRNNKETSLTWNMTPSSCMLFGFLD